MRFSLTFLAAAISSSLDPVRISALVINNETPPLNLPEQVHRRFRALGSDGSVSVGAERSDAMNPEHMIGINEHHIAPQGPHTRTNR